MSVCRRICVLALLGWAVLVSVSELSSAQPQLKLMSFNLRYANTNDGANAWSERTDLVLKVLNDYSPDILAVQEALPVQEAWLKATLKEWEYSGRSRSQRPGDERVGILWRKGRLQRLRSGTFWLSDKPDQVGSVALDAALPRTVQWVELKDQAPGGTRFFVFAAHFDHRGQAARALSAKVVQQQINRLCQGAPAVVMGDFNAPIGSPPYRTLIASASGSLSGKLVDSRRAFAPKKDPKGEGTFNGFKGERGGARIDWILTPQSWSVLDAQIVRYSKNNRWPSDHYPVTATVATGNKLGPKIAVVGASVSAGFRNRYNLGEALQASLPSATVVQLASSRLFLDPLSLLEQQIMAGTEAKADIMVALDAIFWMTARQPSDQAALDAVDEALELFDQYEGRILLGTVPVIKKVKLYLIKASDIPGAARLAIVNRRLEEYSKQRKNVEILPIAAWVEDIRAGREIQLGTKSLRLDPKKVWHSDGLHLSPEGLLITSMMVQKQMRELRMIPASAGLTDLQVLRTRLVAGPMRFDISIIEQGQALSNDPFLRILVEPLEASVEAEPAMVELKRQFAEPISSVTDGMSFVIPKQLRGRVRVMARLETNHGPQSAWSEPIIPAGPVTQIPLLVAPPEPTTITFIDAKTKHRVPSVSARIADPAIHRYFSEGTATSGEDGILRLSSLSPSFYGMKFSASGYKTYSGTVRGGGQHTFVLMPE